MTPSPTADSRIGLPADRVCLVPYSPQWPRLFRNETRRLRRRLRGISLSVAHVGSTAVPGLPAKPVIDIALRPRDRTSLRPLIRSIVAAGYEYKGEYGLKGRHFFVRGTPVTHHLHLVFAAEPHWIRWIAFRNYLRRHADARRQYAALKLSLSKRYARQRPKYTAAKTPFVEKILSLALSS